MEKLLKPYDKEYMRLAMLKHEETFKQQVNELHRLYQIQKLLMDNNGSTGSNKQSQEKLNSSGICAFPTQTIQKDTRIKLDLEQPAKEHISELGGDQDSDIIDESEIELTLGPANSYRKKKAGTPPNSDLGPSFSSSSTGSSQINRTILGTYQRTDKTREVLSGFHLGLVQVPETITGFQAGSKNSTAEDRLSGDKMESRLWLIQPLSLNMT